jgi:FAD/FMN-containing dehydrogenase
MAATHVTAVELVLADGRLVRADAEHEPELFWALRGGGGSFGVVTAMEFRLFPIETAYAGMLVWDRADAEKVLRTWARWAVDAPDAVTTAFRILQLPPFEEIPEPIRGRQLTVIDGAVLGDDETAEQILAELRALQPEMDTFARVPAASLVRLHMDPEGPTPGVGSTSVLGSLPDEAVDAFLSVVGHGTENHLLLAELRQAGGALARVPEGAGSFARIDGQFVMFSVAVAATPEMKAAGHADAVRFETALRPWANGRHYLNFVEREVDPGDAYPAEAWARLRAVKAAVDPAGTILANHRIPAAGPDGSAAELPHQR